MKPGGGEVTKSPALSQQPERRESAAGRPANRTLWAKRRLERLSLDGAPRKSPMSQCGRSAERLIARSCRCCGRCSWLAAPVHANWRCGDGSGGGGAE